MPTYNFQVMAATTKAAFTCTSCGKENRTRTFRGECTVNPFNVNDDGTMKTPAEVRRQSQECAEAERVQFMREPLCAACENAMSWTERKQLSDRRRAAEATVAA